MVPGVIAKCVQHRRYVAKGIEKFPMPLSGHRDRDALVFEVTGVDVAGPFCLKEGGKTWILLFTCAVYHVVHLELITSLPTKGFNVGQRMFVARCG